MSWPFPSPVCFALFSSSGFLAKHVKIVPLYWDWSTLSIVKLLLLSVIWWPGNDWPKLFVQVISSGRSPSTLHVNVANLFSTMVSLGGWIETFGGAEREKEPNMSISWQRCAELARRMYTQSQIGTIARQILLNASNCTHRWWNLTISRPFSRELNQDAWFFLSTNCT